MRTKTNQLAIVAFSFALSDLLATGPIADIRFAALCRGKRRFARVRALGRRIQSVFDRLGLAVSTTVARVRDRVQAGWGRVGSRVRAGCRLAREGAVSVHESIERRVARVSDRVTQVAKVGRMYAELYGMVLTVGRKRRVMGWTVVATSLPEPTSPLPNEPVPALAHALPMVGAARVTTEDQPARDKTDLLNRAKALMSEGQSKRATAKAIGVSESTLRSWLKKE